MEIPESIKEGIRQLSKVHNVSVKELVSKLGKILKEDANVQTMENDGFKMSFAYTVLCRDYVMLGSAETVILCPTHYPDVSEITTREKQEKMMIGKLGALVRKIETDEKGNIIKGDVQFAAGTFFRDAAKKLQNLEKGVVYRAGLRTKKHEWGLEISSNSPTFVKVDGEEMPTIEEFYKEQIEPQENNISLAEIGLNKSEYPTELRIIEARILNADVAKRADDSEYGIYDVMDGSTPGSSHRMYLHARDIIWNQGSTVKFCGTIDILDNGNEIWNQFFQIPIPGLVMKREFVIKPVTEGQDEIDINAEEDDLELPEDEGEKGKSAEEKDVKKQEEETKTEDIKSEEKQPAKSKDDKETGEDKVEDKPKKEEQSIAKEDVGNLDDAIPDLDKETPKKVVKEKKESETPTEKKDVDKEKSKLKKEKKEEEVSDEDVDFKV